MCISSNAPSPPPTQALHTPQPPPPITAQDFFLSWGTPPVTSTLLPEALFLDVSMVCHDPQTGV